MSYATSTLTQVSRANARFKAVVFNLGSRPQRSREPFLEGSRVDILCTQLYYICFIRGLDGGRWVMVV